MLRRVYLFIILIFVLCFSYYTYQTSKYYNPFVREEYKECIEAFLYNHPKGEWFEISQCDHKQQKQSATVSEQSDVTNWPTIEWKYIGNISNYHIIHSKINGGSGWYNYDFHVVKVTGNKMRIIDSIEGSQRCEVFNVRIVDGNQIVYKTNAAGAGLWYKAVDFFPEIQQVCKERSGELKEGWWESIGMFEYSATLDSSGKLSKPDLIAFINKKEANELSIPPGSVFKKNELKKLVLYLCNPDGHKDQLLSNV